MQVRRRIRAVRSIKGKVEFAEAVPDLEKLMLRTRYWDANAEKKKPSRVSFPRPRGCQPLSGLRGCPTVDQLYGADNEVRLRKLNVVFAAGCEYMRRGRRKAHKMVLCADPDAAATLFLQSARPMTGIVAKMTSERRRLCPGL